MDISSLIRESRVKDLKGPLGFTTDVGKQQFDSQLQKFTSNIGILQRRQETIGTLRSLLNPERIQTLDTLFESIHRAEPEFTLFFEKTDVEKDSYQQLLFSGWKPLQVLNTIPFGLLCLSHFKQYVVPALAVLTPLFMILMPYIFLTYVYNLPLTIEQYTHIVMGMFGLQTLDLTSPRTLLQGGLTLFSMGQSIYQPIQNAIHLQTIHVEMMKKAQSLQLLVAHMKTLRELFPSMSLNYSLDDLESQDIHCLFGTVWDSPYRLQMALTTLGDCEVIYRLARASFLVPVELLDGTRPSLHITRGVDPFLTNAIPFDLDLTGTKHHAVLTGPNRGGKSSVLRSTLLNVVLAQTVGMASGHVRLRPFDWIATGLRLEDRPGSTSMFESEVEFAIQIVRRAKENPDQIGFVFFDELFHSTNPPDGARTADIFLQKLWQTRNTASFISTHVFELAKRAHKRIQRLCVPAYKAEDTSLTFTYTLQEGICEVSSVDVILKEKGLLSAESSTPENHTQ